MSEIMEDISYLSQEIGPRPAGTEEEQQAALYIADQMQKRTGFTANIEDFNAATQPGLVEAICFGVAALASLLAIIIGALAVPAFLVTLACAILYAFELIDRPLLSHAFERGVSQNVVARYQPGAANEHARGRKVILVANYDSSKVQAELNGNKFGMYPMLLKASSVALLALPVIWLFRMLFGGGALFFNVLACIALVLAASRVALFVMHKMATYNEAANNNATGVATLLEVARIIAEGTVSEEELAAMEAKRAHSAEEAYEAGVVPEDAELEYAEGVAQTEEERLASAKAAIAGITGRPLREYQVEQIDFTPMADRDDIELYNEDMDYGEYAYNEDDELTAALPAVEVEAEVEAQGAATDAAQAATEAEAQANEAESAAINEATFVEPEPAESAPTNMWAAAGFSTPAPAPAVPAPTNEPDWYTTGRAKAVKPDNLDSTPIRRSRYADALDAALASSSAHIEKAARMLDEGTIGRISEMQRNISAGKSGAPLNEAPLQDLLSDDVKLEAAVEEAELAEAVEAVTAEAAVAEAVETAAVESAVDEALTEAAEAAVVEEAVETAAVEAAVAEAAEAAAKPHVPIIDLNEAVESPAQPQEPAAGETIAMAPIDVNALRAEGEAANAEAASTEAPEAEANAAAEEPAAPYRDHDFSQIGAPARRFRDMDMVSISAENGFEEDNAPARYSNPLQSERIPRIAHEEANPISVMEEIKVAEQATQEESIEEKRAALRNAIPSLSGEFSPIVVTEPKSEEENTEVSKTGSFATASAAVPFEPVGDELVADLKPEERYVDDADDSSFEETTTETGAYAGPGYVEMPESRLSRFFNRFRKKPAVEEESTNEWLDVDDNYQAREVGAARGSWESFRQGAEDAADGAANKLGSAAGAFVGAAAAAVDKVEDVVEGAVDKVEDVIEGAVDKVEDVFDGDQESTQDSTQESTQESLFDEYEYVDVDEEERNWHGGAFSQMRARLLGDAEAEEAAAELVDEVEANAADLTQAIEIEDAPVAERVSSVAVPLVDTTEDARIAEETKMIYSFRNPDINTEVWFVALGAEYAGNSGMKAFLTEHASDFRGAIIVNLEAMGAGQLSFIEEEGLVLMQKPSSRLKRFLSKATEITGISVEKARIDWRESAASLALKRGLQAFTLAGMEGGKPALLGQGDDVLENTDEAQVAENAQFIVEMIKNI